MTAERFDVLVIGAGPAGQKAAVQAAKAGRTVAMVDRQRAPGGSCVHHGTIPSKALREAAVRLGALRDVVGGAVEVAFGPDLELASLMAHKDEAVRGHARVIGEQLARNGIEVLHGRARFVDAHSVAVESVRGGERVLEGGTIVVATGSRPRVPEQVPVDHEHVLDSDSVLAMSYLPRSLVVLGGGVVACEYAATFASLGVPVTLVDRAARPLSFLDEELSRGFVAHFEAREGCVHVGRAEVAEVAWDGVSEVVTTLGNGWTLRSEKVLCALGRVANVEVLDPAAAGLEQTARGHVVVDDLCRTSVPHIFAVGDVIGPPALASCSMEQGRRAARAALGLPLGAPPELVPIGIYTIPELASVGLTAEEARERHGDCLVGRADFSELARAMITGNTGGFLKLVAAPDGRVVGGQVLGEGATEIVHLVQMALSQGAHLDVFVENIFNFPTMAEACRVAALDALGTNPTRS